MIEELNSEPFQLAAPSAETGSTKIIREEYDGRNSRNYEYEGIP